jgi:hypothetical protein
LFITVEFIHCKFKINNAGPFSVNFFQLLIDWPYESKLTDFNSASPIKYFDGKHLLYLTEKPTVCAS